MNIHSRTSPAHLKASSEDCGVCCGPTRLGAAMVSVEIAGRLRCRLAHETPPHHQKGDKWKKTRYSISRSA